MSSQFSSHIFISYSVITGAHCSCSEGGAQQALLWKPGETGHKNKAQYSQVSSKLEQPGPRFTEGLTHLVLQKP